MLVRSAFEAHLQACESTLDSLAQDIENLGRLLAQILRDGGIIYWCGNGGSSSDAQHLCAELVGRFRKSREPLRSVAFNTNVSTLTCIANDFSYDEVFSRQVDAFMNENDALVCISTSGNSPNVVLACDHASKKDATTVALVGKGGGHLCQLAHHSLVVPSDSTARIQEIHILIGHILCEIIEKELQLD